MSELLECPFCGDEGKVYDDAFVRCTQCEAQSAIFYSADDETNKQRAIDAWNRRAVPEWLETLIVGAKGEHHTWIKALKIARRMKATTDAEYCEKKIKAYEDAFIAAEAWMGGK